MNEIPQKPEDFQELAGLVKASFPDIRCLRCGHDTLYLLSEHAGLPGYISAQMLDSELMNRQHPVLTLSCTRCGHVEHFLTGILERSPKPVPLEQAGG